MNHQTYIDIISGKRSGIRAAALRGLLAGVSLGYKEITRLRNGLYDHSLKKIHRVNAGVISIGNLTTGGTGKTPLVIWLCQHLQQQHKSCAILTRGYKSSQKHPEIKTPPHDEVAEFQAACPDIPVIVNADRIAGAQTAIKTHHVQTLIIDDGFQHRRLARNLDIVTVDATLPFGFGRIFPAGLLREPLEGIRRAHAVVLTRCDLVDADRLHAIEAQIRDLHAHVVLCCTVHKPYTLDTITGTTMDIETLRGKRVVVACGIARPEAFKQTLEHLGAHVVNCDITNDHHHYTQADMDRIAHLVQKAHADVCVFPQKNRAGVCQCRTPEPLAPVFLQIRIEFLSGKDALIQLIDQTLTGKIVPVT